MHIWLSQLSQFEVWRPSLLFNGSVSSCCEQIVTSRQTEASVFQELFGVTRELPWQEVMIQFISDFAGAPSESSCEPWERKFLVFDQVLAEHITVCDVRLLFNVTTQWCFVVPARLQPDDWKNALCHWVCLSNAYIFWQSGTGTSQNLGKTLKSQVAVVSLKSCQVAFDSRLKLSFSRLVAVRAKLGFTSQVVFIFLLGWVFYWKAFLCWSHLPTLLFGSNKKNYRCAQVNSAQPGLSRRPTMCLKWSWRATCGPRSGVDKLCLMYLNHLRAWIHICVGSTGKWMSCFHDFSNHESSSEVGTSRARFRGPRSSRHEAYSISRSCKRRKEEKVR